LQEYQQIKPGDIIISSPYAGTGMIFNKAVIYITSCNEDRISGVIINKLLSKVDNKIISKALSFSDSNYSTDSLVIDNIPIYFGGPVEQEKGIILHSSDYQKSSTTNISENISISTNINIISDISSNKGPIHKMLILGYTAWSTHQLLAEIKRNDWILLPNEPNLYNFYDLIFIEEYYLQWNQALKLAKIDLNHYNNFIGNA
jgi:putative transcriptional regulator